VSQCPPTPRHSPRTVRSCSTRTHHTTSSAPSAPAAPSPFAGETVSQRNARQRAADYLDYTSFSRKGLIDQLGYEGFTQADAYGVDALKVDWNEQAAKKAADYLKYKAAGSRIGSGGVGTFALLDGHHLALTWPVDVSTHDGRICHDSDGRYAGCERRERTFRRVGTTPSRVCTRRDRAS
jgi:hypothetical protein